MTSILAIWSQVRGKSLASLLGPILHYKFTLPDQALRRGYTHQVSAKEGEGGT